MRRHENRTPFFPPPAAFRPAPSRAARSGRHDSGAGRRKTRHHSSRLRFLGARTHRNSSRAASRSCRSLRSQRRRSPRATGAKDPRIRTCRQAAPSLRCRVQTPAPSATAHRRCRRRHADRSCRQRQRTLTVPSRRPKTIRAKAPGSSDRPGTLECSYQRRLAKAAEHLLKAHCRHVKRDGSRTTGRPPQRPDRGTDVIGLPRIRQRRQRAASAARAFPFQPFHVSPSVGSPIFNAHIS